MQHEGKLHAMRSTQGIALGLPREEIEIGRSTSLCTLGCGLTQCSGTEARIDIGHLLGQGIRIGLTEGCDELRTLFLAHALTHGGFGLSPCHIITHVEGKLIEISTNEHRHILCQRRGWIEGMLGQDDAVDHWREPAADATLRQTADSIVQLIIGVFREIGLCRSGLSQLLSQSKAELSRGLWLGLTQCGSALHNSPMEQTFSTGHGQ